MATAGSAALSRWPTHAKGADVLISYLDETEDALEAKALIEREGRKAITGPR